MCITKGDVMNTARKAQRLDRKNYVNALKEVLTMLNKTDTGAELANETILGKKYLITNKNDKIEVNTTASNILINNFHDGAFVKSFVVFKDGPRVKSKAWLLEFKLKNVAEKPFMERLVAKLKNRQY